MPMATYLPSYPEEQSVCSLLLPLSSCLFLISRVESNISFRDSMSPFPACDPPMPRSYAATNKDAIPLSVRKPTIMTAQKFRM